MEKPMNPRESTGGPDEAEILASKEDELESPSTEPLPADEPPPEEDEPFDEDFPCIRCGYNLRGLKPDGNCPECGARIGKSLDFAMERVLCLACACPVHPSIPKCPNCGAPMNTVAGFANYWQVTPRGVTRKKPPRNADAAEGQPVGPRLPPLPRSPKIFWFLCAPPAFLLIGVALLMGPEHPAEMGIACLIALLLLVPPIRATCTFQRRWNERQRQVAVLLKEAGEAKG
jgi:hypothetical protein